MAVHPEQSSAGLDGPAYRMHPTTSFVYPTQPPAQQGLAESLGKSATRRPSLMEDPSSRPQDEKPITRQMSRVYTFLDHVTEEVNHLSQRLMPVLRQEGPCEAEKQVEEPYQSLVEGQLLGIAGRLLGLRDRLRDLSSVG